jgi:glycerol-3-phosphate cytidylyltransferase
MLKDCSRICDYLIVALQSDPTVDRPNKNVPVQSLEERMILLESIKYIDEIRTYTTEQELHDMLVEISPDVRIIGSDWKGKNHTGVDLDIPIYYHPRNHGWSTTNLRKRIINNNK